MRVFKFFLMLCLIAVGSTNYAQTLHAILVDGGSTASATSVALCKQRLEQICNTTGMTANIKTVSSSNSSLPDALRTLRVGADDVSLLHYAGHGRNSQENDFPTFNGGEQSFAHADMVNFLQQKGGRLTIVVYDCCNHGAVTRPSGTATSPPGFEDIWSKMFLEYSGVVRMCSSEPNKYSFEIRNYGGVFTNSFFEAFKDKKLLTARTPKQAWEIFGAVVQERTNAKNTKLGVPLQNPLFRLGTARGTVAPNSSRRNAGGEEDNTQRDQQVIRGATSNTPEKHEFKPKFGG